MMEPKYYILNSAVITSPGIWKYEPITLDEAREWVLKHKPESTIGYAETAKALELLLELEEGSIAVNKVQVRMRLFDEALVFRLTKRIAEAEMKGKQGLEFILKHFEIGLLRKIGEVSGYELK